MDPTIVEEMRETTLMDCLENLLRQEDRGACKDIGGKRNKERHES